MTGITQKTAGVGKHTDEVTKQTEVRKADQLIPHALFVVVEPPGTAVLDFSGRFRSLESANERIDKGVVRGIQTVDNRFGQTFRLIEPIQKGGELAASVVGADAVEAGIRSQSRQHLRVTMDRKYKKDSFYAYKAWLVSPETDPFVHLCGKRYIDRVEDVTKVTVYSNLPEVELFVNGESIGKKTAEDHFFYFDVPNVGESTIVAKAGDLSDEGKIRKVAEMNMDYVLVEKGAVLNWFDIDAPEGRFSLNDKISDIMSCLRGKLWFAGMGMMLKKKMDASKKEKKDDKKSGGFDVDMKGGNMGGMMEMLGGFSVLRLSSMMGMMNISFTKEELLKMNKQLNRIRKPKKKN